MKRKLLLAALCVVGALGFKVHAQKDVTSQYITNATLSQGYNTGWTAVGFHAGPTQGHNTTGYTVECWAGNLERTSYSLTQDITLPKGNYRLVNYSFYRYGGAYNTDASTSEAYLKAGNQQVAIKTLGSITGQAAYADNMAQAANRFETKMYRNVVEFTVDADNTVVNIGVTGTHTTPWSWFICGMFELFDLDDLASVSSPTDMTYAITNPGFEYLNLEGWTNSPSGAFWYMDNGNWSNAHNGVGWVESWHANGTCPDISLSQTLTGLQNGLYEVTVMAQARGGDGYFVFANDDKTAIGSTRGDYSVRTTVTDGNLTLGVKTISFAGDWDPVDNFRLKFYGDPLKAYQDLLDAAVATAQAYINSNPALSATQISALQNIVNDNDNDDYAFTEESQFNTAIETIEAAVATYQAMVAPYAAFNALKTSANAIAAVAYTETTSGSHDTFTDAITARATAADNATTAAAITTATTALKTAIKTYIAGAEPANDGEYFDITCLMVNPNFDDSHNGWTKEIDPGVAWSNCEYYEKEFDINQTVTGLPTGSYSLSVQAFQRPGWAGNVYTDYSNGTDNASSVLYINSITSNVKNIMADAQDDPKLDKVEGKNYGDWPYDSQVGSEGNYKYLPNSQQGANLYFEAGLYDATCAAVVDDEANGSLTLGFKSTKDHVAGDWTIFDNFRLYYYGSSLLVYYKQYLPQLKSEASADLSNARYNNVTGKEKGDFETALAATPVSETEDAYKAVIDDIIAKQTAFRNAKDAYDALVAAKATAKMTKVSTNIGDDAFQYKASTNDQLYAAYEAAYNVMMATDVQSTTTAADITTALNAYNARVNNYINQELNAPEEGDVFNVMITTGDNYAFKENPLTFNADNEGGAYFPQGVYVKAYRAQQITFTKVSGNQYTMSMVNADGNRVYIGTNKTINNTGEYTQIRLTTDGTKALAVEVVPTTEGVYNLRNTEADALLGCQDNPSEKTTGGLFTTNSHSDFTITAAEKPSVGVTISAGKYATRIFPFTPEIPEDVTVYSISQAQEGVLTLAEVGTLEANKPYILYSENGYAGDDLTGYGTATEDSYTEGSLTGVYTASTIAASEGNVNRFVLQTQGARQAFYQVGEGGFTSTPYRCYLTVDNTANTTKARAFYFNGAGEDATAINALEVLTTGEYDAIYNAAGAKMDALQKGVNIIKKGGKTYKIFVK